MAFQYGMLMQLSMMLLVVLVLATTHVVARTRASAREAGAEEEIAIAPHGCKDKCGNLRIPYPFGIGDSHCYFGPRFQITCNDGSTEPRLMESRMIVTNISLEDGELEVLQLVNRECYDAKGEPTDREDQSSGGLRVYPPYTISGDKNRMFVVGCDTYAVLVGSRGTQSYTTGCISKCDNNPGDYAHSVDKNDTCTGMGCCRTKIPPLLNDLTLTVGSYNNHSEVNRFNPCGYAFVVKKDNFTFGKTSFQDLHKTHRLPLVLDWQIRDESCDYAKQNKETFACKGDNSICHDKPSSGYICKCKDGYQGNPYLPDSCRDINECALNSTLCKHGKCENKEGNYICVCDSGYKNQDDITCIEVPSAKPLKISLGVSLSFSVLLVAIFGMYRKQRKSHVEKLKRTYFQANGGELLRKEMASLGEPRYFTEEEVKDKDATNNYDKDKKVGEGRYGIVYKGILKVGESKEWVAIKKSRVSFPIHQNEITSPIDNQKPSTGQIDPKQIAAQEQFVNEMTALYKINHKNVVRLMGCCLEIPKPILVYEFMRKGSLYKNIHGQDGEKLSLADQLRIAAETAGALGYLHEESSPPIKHGDVKTSSILLDDEFKAKLSGFGASRPVREEDENQASKSNTITEKSDVYSFGLVLAELLTGIKREENLENIFLALVKGGTLGQTLDKKILNGHSDEVKKAGDLAIECLKSKEKEGPCPSMKDVASKLREIVQSMKQNPNGGGEPNISSSPKDTANLGGPSASSAFVMDIRDEGGDADGDGDGGGFSGIITSADSSIMEITPHGDGQ